MSAAGRRAASPLRRLSAGEAETRALGIDPEQVRSPTYTLVREHRGPGGARLVHLDLYRLEPEEALELGLEEILAGPGVKVVEWADRLPLPVPGAPRLHLQCIEEDPAASARAGREIVET